MAKGRKRLIVGSALIGLGLAATVVTVASRWYFVRAELMAGLAVWSGKGGVHFIRYSNLPSFREALFIDSIEPPELSWLLNGYPDWKSSFNFGVFCLQRGETGFGPVWLFEVECWPVALVLFTLGGTMSLSGRRAKRRARLDLCPACGYDLKGLAAGTGCPECGKEK